MAKKVELTGVMANAADLIESAKKGQHEIKKITRNIQIDEDLFWRAETVRQKKNMTGEKWNQSMLLNLALREYLDTHYPESKEAYETLKKL